MSVRIRTQVKYEKNFKVSILAEKWPDQIIGVKTNRIYSQIARVGRNPKKKDEIKILISALDNACEYIEVGNRTVRKEPLFIPMKAKDVVFCFGNQVDKWPNTSFIELVKYKA